ncbi:MAG: hypothetical protein KKI02_06465 [Planctomycetes bacterium]|nr:hypothetical protein [Planctomycetota bacterium]
MSTGQDFNATEPCRGSVTDWPRLVERAADAVCRELRIRGGLFPREVAKIAAEALPPEVARWLIGRLEVLGWLDPQARVPFDILDSPGCPHDLRDGRREFVRIAVFGVPGEGVRSDAKRREAIFQQRCSEIMRETRNLESLSYAAARALGHPEVHTDPVLHAMLRAFISEREAEIRARAQVPGTAEDEEAEAHPAVKQAPEFRLPLRERVQGTLSKLRLELEGHLTNYNEAGARETLVRIRDLRKRYPGHVELEVVERCEEQLKRVGEKRDLFRKQLTELVEQAAEAVTHGDQKTAAWVLRRLSAIHKLLPAILPEDRLKELRQTVVQSEQRLERHEAARNLVAREQAVGAEIKRLGAIIHRYHRLSQRGPADHAVIRRAEEEYRGAVQEVRSHNDEWLADLMIELDCLLEDLHGPRNRAEAQVDKFVNNVRLALRSMQEEIEQIQRERAASLKGE